MTFAVAITVEGYRKGKRFAVGFGARTEEEFRDALGDVKAPIRRWLAHTKAQVAALGLTGVQWKKNGKAWNPDEALKPGSQPS